MKCTFFGLAVVAAFSVSATANAQQAIDGVPFDRIGDANPRAGNASNQDLREMPISDMLNLLSAQGFARYDRVERIGDVYRINAVTTDLRDVLIEIDTRTGTIIEIE